MDKSDTRSERTVRGRALRIPVDSAFASALAVSLVLTLAPAASAFPFVNAAKAGPTTETLTQTDIDVIVAASRYLAEHTFARSKVADGQFLAIQMEAAAGEIKNGKYLPSEFVDDATTDTLVIDLLQRNRLIYLQPKEIRVEDVRIVGEKTVERWLAKKTMEQEFPTSKSKGWVYAWLPGYGPDGQVALVYVFNTGSDDMGLDMWGVILRLRRDGKSWKVVESKLAWQS